MPEFTLDHGTRDAGQRFQALDEFTQGYIEAMFFTETGTSDDGDMENATVADLAEETWRRIESDCKRFMDNVVIVVAIDGREGEAGRDFWYTRNGHGAGFWDGDWPEPFAGMLSAAARGFGAVDLYMGDDGKLYFG